MEVAAPPPSPKPPLRLLPLNPLHLLRPLPSSTSTTTSISPPPPPIPNRLQPPPLFTNLLTSLRSLLPQRRRPAPKAAEEHMVGCAVPLFRPYVARLPWHGGARAILSRMFPRYGHYCGPNWSSGKEGGSVLWDQRPLDHLDFCCYCHDMAYDTHDQARLLRADLAFLRCLESSRSTPARDGAAAAAVYRAMCIAGLKTILIPYRTNLVRLQSGPHFVDVFGDLVKRIASSSGRPEGNQKQAL